MPFARLKVEAAQETTLLKFEYLGMQHGTKKSPNDGWTLR